jgi:hypothetical protein
MHGNTDHLASRVREIRLDVFGEDGIDRVAQALNIPARTWENYESGVLIPSRMLLQFIELTDADPYWLLTGDGMRYRIRSADSSHRASQ